MILAALFIGGAAAAGLVRAWATVGRRWRRIPVPTLAVNVAGSLLVGLVSTSSTEAVTVLGVAVAGSLTTFSAVARDTHALLDAGRGRDAVAYLVLSLVACTAAAGAGMALAR